MRNCYRIVRLITNSARAGFGVDFNNQIEVVMLLRPFAEVEHLREFVGRVDMQNRKRNAPQEGFARKPD